MLILSLLLVGMHSAYSAAPSTKFCWDSEQKHAVQTHGSFELSEDNFVDAVVVVFKQTQTCNRASVRRTLLGDGSEKIVIDSPKACAAAVARWVDFIMLNPEKTTLTTYFMGKPNQIYTPCPKKRMLR